MTSASRLTALVVLAALDAVAGRLFLSGSSSRVAPAIALHAVVCFASTAVIFTPGSRWIGADLRLRVLALALVFFVPLVGAIGMLAALESAFGARPPAAPTWRLTPIDDDPRRGVPRRPPRLPLDRAPAILRPASQAPGPERMRAVLRISQQADPEAVALLRSCLEDSFDEVRLFAFARLERLRDDIEASNRRLAQLSSAPLSDVERAGLHLRIAENHWEVCYLGLADGVVLDDALERAREHAEQARRLAAGDAAPAFLLGRIHLKAGRLHEAIDELQAALSNGLPDERALPYLAEALFDQREYGVVAALMRRLATRTRDSACPSGILEYWR